MTSVQALITILAIAAGTQFTRWLPFWLFPEKKDPPAVVLYLGKVLPPAMMGLLVVYCFKGVHWLSGTHGLPELIAAAVVVLLQECGLALRDPWRAGAAGLCRRGGIASVEAERAVLYRRGHGAVHGSGASRFRIK